MSFQVYLSAPSIDGIFGLYFGTSMTSSLDYLYYSGYNIDGYYDNIIYLRDANLMNYSWPDVMLSFDEYNNFEYAQFSIASTYYDMARFNSLKSRLRATYGTPVSVTRDQITWIGGNRHGYVTLSMNYDNGLYFTSLSFGY